MITQALCVAVLSYTLNMESGLVIKKRSNVTDRDIKRIGDLLTDKEFIKGNQIKTISNIKLKKEKKPFPCSRKK